MPDRVGSCGVTSVRSRNPCAGNSHSCSGSSLATTTAAACSSGGGRDNGAPASTRASYDDRRAERGARRRVGEGRAGRGRPRCRAAGPARAGRRSGEVEVPRRRAGREARRRVVLPRHQRTHHPGRVLDHQVGDEHTRRHRAGRWRPEDRRPRVHVDTAVEEHAGGRRHRAESPEQRFRPRVEPGDRLRAAPRGRGSHRVRRRAPAGTTARSGLGVQQLRDPDAAAGRPGRNRAGPGLVRATAAVRAARHDRHADDNRPRRQRADVRGRAVDVSRHGALRRAHAEPRQMGHQADRVVGLGEGRDRSLVAGVERRVRVLVVAEPQGRHRQPARRHRPEQGAEPHDDQGPDRAGCSRRHVLGARTRQPDRAGRSGIEDGRRAARHRRSAPETTHLRTGGSEQGRDRSRSRPRPRPSRASRSDPSEPASIPARCVRAGGGRRRRGCRGRLFRLRYQGPPTRPHRRRRRPPAGPLPRASRTWSRTRRSSPPSR